MSEILHADMNTLCQSTWVLSIPDNMIFSILWIHHGNPYFFNKATSTPTIMTMAWCNGPQQISSIGDTQINIDTANRWKIGSRVYSVVPIFTHNLALGLQQVYDRRILRRRWEKSHFLITVSLCKRIFSLLCASGYLFTPKFAPAYFAAIFQIFFSMYKLFLEIRFCTERNKSLSTFPCIFYRAIVLWLISSRAFVVSTTITYFGGVATRTRYSLGASVCRSESLQRDIA